MGAKTASGAVNIEVPRNAAFVTSEPLIANLVIGDLAQGPAFVDAVLGDRDNAILGMQLGIHALNDIANQHRFIIGLTKGTQNMVDVTVAREFSAAALRCPRGSSRCRSGTQPCRDGSHVRALPTVDR